MDRLKKRLHLITVSAALAAGFTAGQLTAIGAEVTGSEQVVKETVTKSLKANALPTRRAAAASALCPLVLETGAAKCGPLDLRVLSVSWQGEKPHLSGSFFRDDKRLSVSKELGTAAALGLRGIAATRACTDAGDRRGITCVTSNVSVLSINWNAEQTNVTVLLEFGGTWAPSRL